jgi:hypothetical protein
LEFFFAKFSISQNGGEEKKKSLWEEEEKEVKLETLVINIPLKP